jgi:hypothetical protein
VLYEEQRHLLWKRASHEPWKDICAWMGCDRTTTAWRRWNGAMGAVVVVNRVVFKLHRAAIERFVGRLPRA